MATLTPKQIYALAADAGFKTPGQATTMTAIALAESGGNTDATNTNKNGSTDTGLWQINSIHHISGDLKDPRTNAQAAKKIYDSQGLGAWVAFKNGNYRRHLGESLTAASQVTGGPGIADILRGLPVAAGVTRDFAGNVVDEAVPDNPLGALRQMVALMAKAGTFLVDPQNWLRVAYVALGAALVIGGLLVIARPVIEPAIKAGTKVAKVAL